MVHFVLLLAFLLTSSPSTATQSIEKAFLQNNSKLLFSLFPEKTYIPISLPQPLSFSDIASSQQAYFLFEQIFSSYSTFEFYPESQSSSSPEESFIFKTRWSFKDKKSRNQYVFHVYFLLLKQVNKEKDQPEESWKITEIKAERL